MKPDGLMGCAIFWRTEVLKLREPTTAVSFINEETGKVDNQLYFYAKLTHIPTNTPLTVATTHLKAKKPFAKVRAQQAI